MVVKADTTGCAKGRAAGSAVARAGDGDAITRSGAIASSLAASVPRVQFDGKVPADVIGKMRPSAVARRRALRDALAASARGREPHPADPEAILWSLSRCVPPALMESFSGADGGTLSVLGPLGFKSELASLRRAGGAGKLGSAIWTLGVLGMFAAEPDVCIAVNGIAASPDPLTRLSMGWQDVLDIAGHEFGHYADAAAGLPSLLSGRFAGAFLAERHALDWYHASDPHEFFAEAFWLRAAYPQAAGEWLPETSALMDSLFGPPGPGR